MERFLDYFVPDHYNLDFSIDKFKKTIEGKVNVVGKALNETIKFHAVGLKISKVMVNGKDAEFKADDKVLEVYNVFLSPAVDIIIEYSGILNENMEGAYLSTYEYEGRKEIIVTTQFESHYAREAFPCVDEPAAKATLPRRRRCLLIYWHGWLVDSMGKR